MDKPAGTPFDPGYVSQVSAGYRLQVSYGIGEGNTWFGPGAPMQPVTPPGMDARTFDYQSGLNLQTNPRRDSVSGAGFTELRALADGYDLLRLVIETRKDQIEALDWLIRPKLKKGKKASGAQTKRAEAAEEFLQFPDKLHTWQQWLRQGVEEMLVTDALTVYPRPTMGGGVYALDQIDGATIKPLIDETGRSPAPPYPAYQQVLKGLPAVEFTRDELLYCVFNPRVNKLYGFSPVEQVMTTVNLALKRQLTQLNYFTEGNVPEAIMGTPATWTTAQIREFQAHWDSMMIGDMAAQRRMRFVPDGMRYQATREPVSKDVFDDWLARVVCFAFSVSPTPLISQVNRAVAESSLAQASNEGLLPLMKRVKGLVDLCLMRLGYADCEFFWEDDEDEKPLEAAQIHKIYVDAGILTKDEVRAELNRAPLPNGLGEAKAPPAPLQIGHNGGPPIDGETDQPPEEKPGEDEGDEEDPATKIDRPDWLKAFKGIVVSNSRPSLTKAATRLGKAVKTILAAKAAKIATQAEARHGKLSKAEEPMDEDRSRGDEFVESLDFGSWSDLQDVIADYAAEVYEEAGRQAVVALGARVDADRQRELVKVVHKDAVRVAKANAAELVKDISESTRDMLRSTVAHSIEEGWSSQKLAEQIEASGAFSATRAETIARTELGKANSQGCRESWKASGVVEKKRWLLGSDSCDICTTNADQGEIGFDEEFESGHIGPLAHPNCTCDLAAVLKAEEE